MAVAATVKPAHLRTLALGLIILLVRLLNSGASAHDETVKLDCGANALFLLLRFERRPVSFESVVASLPAHHPDGYSMAELSAASRSLGVSLEGVRWVRPTIDVMPRRPPN